jgi:hypothetical protein
MKDIATSARTSLLALRMFDSYWSERVQSRDLPFDNEVARHIHALYAWWDRTYSARFATDDRDVLFVKGLLSMNIEHLIDSMTALAPQTNAAPDEVNRRGPQLEPPKL